MDCSLQEMTQDSATNTEAYIDVEQLGGWSGESKRWDVSFVLCLVGEWLSRYRGLLVELLPSMRFVAEVPYRARISCR